MNVFKYCANYLCIWDGRAIDLSQIISKQETEQGTTRIQTQATALNDTLWEGLSLAAVKLCRPAIFPSSSF